MPITRETAAKITKLARINVPENEMDMLAGQLDKIMGWVEQLSEVNTDGIEPLNSVVAATAPLRADVVTDGGHQADVLENAPESAAGFFVVPKIIE